MTELAIKPSIRKLAKKDDLSIDEAISIIKHYDHAVKSAGSFLAETFLKSEHESSAKLRRIKNRNLTKGLTVSLGFMVAGLGSIFTAAITHAVGPEMMFLFLPVIGVTSAGIKTVADLENGNYQKLHEILSPQAYKAAKDDVEMVAELMNLKNAEFKAVEAKMLKKTANALSVINANLADKNETMFYAAVSDGGNGFIVTKKPEPELDQWDKLRLRLNQAEAEAQEKTLQLSK